MVLGGISKNIPCISPTLYRNVCILTSLVNHNCYSFVADSYGLLTYTFLSADSPLSFKSDPPVKKSFSQ